MKFLKFLLFVLPMIFVSCYSSSKKSSVLQKKNFIPHPENLRDTVSIKKFISSVDSSDQDLLRIYNKIKGEIFDDALSGFNLKECSVSPMFVWMNFCEGLTSMNGSTALTHGYKNSGGYHLVLLVDSNLFGRSDSVLAQLVAHEMIHAYCDHMGLDAGVDDHGNWFDKIALQIERLSCSPKYAGDPFYKHMGNIFRD